MSALNHNEYQVESGRHAVLEWTAKQLRRENGQLVERPIAFVNADDVLWMVAASEGGASVLELSKTPKVVTGSKVVVDELGHTSDPDPANWVAASGRVIIYPADTALLVVTKETIYFDELLLKDSADGNALKTICRGRVRVKPSQS